MTIRTLSLWMLFVGLSAGCAAGQNATADSPLPEPTYSDIPYGPHERNVLDFWQAKGDGARPLLVHIHGGGWVTGDKRQKLPDYQPFLDRGISIASINYRLTPDNPLPAPVHDAARAIQFLRTKATDWRINPRRIAVSGPSAGAESTRVCAAAVNVGQTSIDPKVIEPWLGPNVLQHRMIAFAVGEKTIEEALAHYEKHRAIYVEFSPINHVDANDPPLFMTCSAETSLPSRDAGHGIHHPAYGLKLKEKSDACGHECYLIIPGVSQPKEYANGNAFLFDKLLKPD
ncbi:MAG: alpha/beta hydrolase [Planctomycetota bacterium]|nr:alpha/beta hydrolase [Planctomycetota bacterium]